MSHCPNVQKMRRTPPRSQLDFSVTRPPMPAFLWMLRNNYPVLRTMFDQNNIAVAENEQTWRWQTAVALAKCIGRPLPRNMAKWVTKAPKKVKKATNKATKKVKKATKKATKKETKKATKKAMQKETKKAKKATKDANF